MLHRIPVITQVVIIVLAIVLASVLLPSTVNAALLFDGMGDCLDADFSYLGQGAGEYFVNETGGNSLHLIRKSVERGQPVFYDAGVAYTAERNIERVWTVPASYDVGRIQTSFNTTRTVAIGIEAGMLILISTIDDDPNDGRDSWLVGPAGERYMVPDGMVASAVIVAQSTGDYAFYSEDSTAVTALCFGKPTAIEDPRPEPLTVRLPLLLMNHCFGCGLRPD